MTNPDTLAHDPSMLDRIRGSLQQFQADTHDIGTISNAIDAAAFVAAMIYTSQMDTWKGIVGTSFSFGADGVDGPFARFFGTSSDLGEKVDAVGDKVKIAKFIYSAWRMNLVPKPILVTVGVQNILNAGLSLADQALNEEQALHSSDDGKKMTLYHATGSLLYVAGTRLKADQKPVASAVTRVAATAIIGLGVKRGVSATRGYAHVLKDSLATKSTKSTTDS